MSLVEIFDKLRVINTNTPEKFEDFRDKLIAHEIEVMCYSDAKCIWRAEGIIRKHRLKHSNIIDPIARCNAHMADMWGCFSELNNVLNNKGKV